MPSFDEGLSSGPYRGHSGEEIKRLLGERWKDLKELRKETVGNLKRKTLKLKIPGLEEVIRKENKDRYGVDDDSAVLSVQVQEVQITVNYLLPTDVNRKTLGITERVTAILDDEGHPAIILKHDTDKEEADATALVYRINALNPITGEGRI